MDFDVVTGDITTVRADVLVTAANSALAGGGGVDRAVHRAAGPELVQASRALAPCPTGGAVLTPSFGLGPVARWVVHAVGPIWSRGDDGEPELLASAYTSALARADEVGAASIAFPALSTGAYGFPARLAAEVSVAALRAADTRVQRCVLVAFDAQQASLWQAALDRH